MKFELKAGACDPINVGIILAGGAGKRLYPLTLACNKHLLPIGGRPMIDHAIFQMFDARITDIAIVVDHSTCGDIIKYVGNGERITGYPLNINYVVQPKPHGIADAINRALKAVREPCCHIAVLLGDNIFSIPILKNVLYPSETKTYYSGHCIVGIKFRQNRSLHDYGVMCLKYITSDIVQGVVSVKEKPNIIDTSDNLVAQSGCYIYNPHDIISMIINKSERGEYEISEIHDRYALLGKLMAWTIDEKLWADAGDFSRLDKANRLAEKYYASR